MSFSVRCAKTGLEYRGADLDGLFSQRRNLINPRFYRLLLDLIRFNRQAQQLIEPHAPESTETVAEFIKRQRLSKTFVDQYLLPMGSAIWSCPHDLFLQFPIQFIAEFYHNHGLLSVRNRPQWRVIQGGSKRYVEQLIKPFSERYGSQHRSHALNGMISRCRFLPGTDQLNRMITSFLLATAIKP